MDLKGLITDFRRIADDRVATAYQYDDATLARFATEAEEEAAFRSRLIFDDTSSFLTIAVLANVNTYRLPQEPEVHAIDYATFQATAGGRPKNLEVRGLDWVQDQCDWESRVGRAEVITHLQDAVRLWPGQGPDYPGTLRLGVYRAPLNALEDLDDEPEIPFKHHIGLVDWMLWKAFSEKDGELGDEQRAAKHLGLFEARFGQRNTANDNRRHRERRRITTRFGGIL